MGQVNNGGMWCDYCNRPVMGVKNTHHVRNTLGVAGIAATGGLSLLLAKTERFVCPNCGNTVRRAWG
jgi:hypothetical protein